MTTYRRNLWHDVEHQTWRCRIERGGRTYKRSFRYRSHSRVEMATAEAHARAWCRMVEAAAAGLEAGVMPVQLDTAIAGYLDRLRLLRRSEATIDYYTRHLEPMQAHLVAGVTLAMIDQRAVDAYVRWRLAGDKEHAAVGAGSVNKELRALRTIYAHAELVPRWKMPALSHHPRERMVRTPEEVARFWALLDSDARAAVGLCLLAGLRASEALAGTAAWLRREQGEIYVPLRKTGGWNRTALVPLLAEVLPAAGPLVRRTKSALAAVLRRASVAAGLDPPYTGPGAMRHHCATWAHELGYTRDQIALVLGHGRPGATGRYLHTQAVGLKREILTAVETRFAEAIQGLNSRDGFGTAPCQDDPSEAPSEAVGESVDSPATDG